MPINAELYILQIYRSKMLIDLELEILKLSYSELENLIDVFNGVGETELAQILFNRKIINL